MVSWIKMATRRVTRSQKSQNGFTVTDNTTNGSAANGQTNLKNGVDKCSTLDGGTQSNGYALDADYVPIQKGGIDKLINEVLLPLFLIPFSANLVIILWYTATKCNGSFLVFFTTITESGVLNGIAKMWSDIHIGSLLVIGILAAYMAFALILMVVLPGPRVEGPVTPKGNIPEYKDNGFYCFAVTMITFIVGTYYLKNHGMTPTVVYDHFGEFLATLTASSILLCMFLQIKGLTRPSSTDCGSSGNPLFDYYWGTELYPRICGIDVKVFTNCRFGMTVWPLLVLIFALKSYELHGFVDSMWVSCALQMIYFTKFFWWEAGYMRTIDIMLDRAGFYICWGCLVFIPGLYASVSLYLVNHPIILGPVTSSIILFSGIACIVINYWADAQKIVVRNTDGKCTIWGKKPDIIRAQYNLENGETRESILLVSGFWAIARHFHYLPELIGALLWTVPAQFENLMPYSYLITICIILIHRTFRDDEKCSSKYGQYWREYSKRVPYKIIPGVF